MTPPDPLVSVVIPTINRPQLVVRAVNGALRQSMREIEVIVVIDGPDPETPVALRSIVDSRLRILPRPERVGIGAARHAGFDVARSRWVALLDDDDEWLPQKLEIQLDTARRSRHRLPIVTCRVIARTEHGETIQPRRRPTQGEPLSEYLFRKTRLHGGEGLVLPSTLLAPRDLFRDARIGFRSVPYEGTDWLLRAVQLEGVGVEFVATSEPLAVWHCDEARARKSNTRDWRESLAWANTQATGLTSRARASFILSNVSLDARRAGAASAFWLLPREALRRDRPSVIDLLAHVIIWLIPLKARRPIALLMNRLFPFRAVTGEDPPGAAIAEGRASQP